jgi:ankyrin repeat protein
MKMDHVCVCKWAQRNCRRAYKKTLPVSSYNVVTFVFILHFSFYLRCVCTIMAAITCISPDDARTLSVSLFRAMETLAHADAHLHSVHWEKEKGEGNTEAKITTTLFRASQVAHSSCESALARVEPFYDTHTKRILADDSAYCSSCSCRSLVSSALKHADIVSMALEHASKNCEITTLPLSVLCGDEAMRAAIDAGDLGAISLAVVLLLELPSFLPPLHQQLVHHALSLRNKTAVIERIVGVLLTVPAIAASACNADTNGDTVLMLASANGHAEIVTALLVCRTVAQSAGAVNKNGFTALMLASANGHAEIVTALLACPIVVQSAGAVNKYGNTALMLASANGHTETVHALLAYPTVVQSAGDVDEAGYTALMLASWKGHTEAVHALLAYPTVVQSAGAVSATGDTALMLASELGRTEIVIALLACPQVIHSAGVGNVCGNTALMHASACGRTDTVTALLACPTVVQSADAVNANGDTALMLASARGCLAIVAALLACPTVVQSADAVNAWGDTALTIAQRRKHDDIIALLSRFM